MTETIRIKMVTPGKPEGWEFLYGVTAARGDVHDGAIPRQEIIALRPYTRLEFYMPRGGRIEIEAC